MLFSSLFSIIDLYILIPAVIEQIFIPTAEFAIPTGTPTNEANVEIKTQPLIKKQKQENVRINSKPYIYLYPFRLLNYYVLSHLKYNSLLHLFFSLNSRLTVSFPIFVFKILIYHLAILFIVDRRK